MILQTSLSIRTMISPELASSMWPMELAQNALQVIGLPSIGTVPSPTMEESSPIHAVNTGVIQKLSLSAMVKYSNAGISLLLVSMLVTRSTSNAHLTTPMDLHTSCLHSLPISSHLTPIWTLSSRSSTAPEPHILQLNTHGHIAQRCNQTPASIFTLKLVLMRTSSRSLLSLGINSLLSTKLFSIKNSNGTGTKRPASSQMVPIQILSSTGPSLSRESSSPLKVPVNIKPALNSLTRAN